MQYLNYLNVNNKKKTYEKKSKTKVYCSESLIKFNDQTSLTELKLAAAVY